MGNEQTEEEKMIPELSATGAKRGKLRPPARRHKSMTGMMRDSSARHKGPDASLLDKTVTKERKRDGKISKQHRQGGGNETGLRRRAEGDRGRLVMDRPARLSGAPTIAKQNHKNKLRKLGGRRRK